MKNIGETFSQELDAAGLLGLPFSWTDDGQFNFSNLEQDKIAAIQQIYKAHDPAQKLPVIVEDPVKLAEVTAIAEKADDDTPVTAAEQRKFMAAVSKKFGWIQ